MAHQVQVNRDEVVLPDGREYDSGAVVTLTDREFSQVRSTLFSGGSPVLTDLGEVAGTSGDLSGLGDVVISSPQIGDLMKWNGSHWVNAQPAADIDVGGVGGGGSHDGQMLDWYLTHDALAAAANISPGTTDAQIYAADGTPGQEVTAGDIASPFPPINIGDDYTLTTQGAHLLHFRNPGLYVAGISLPDLVGVGVRATYTGLGSTWFTGEVTELNLGAFGQLVFSVGARDVWAPNNAYAGALSLIVANNTAAPQDVWVEVYIRRVL